VSRSKVILAALAVVVVLVAVALWAFQPWRLVTSSELDQAAPVSEPREASTAAAPAGADPSPSPKDEVLATGRFEDAEHATSGAVRLIELADGRRFVRLEGLASSDGPDLHVWLSDRPSGGEWGSYDDGRYVALGLLKATHGNHNYAVPADVDLDSMQSVVIWCDRFNVAFGTAPVTV
jgi:hypothetical protein